MAQSQLSAIPIEKSVPTTFQNNSQWGLNILKLMQGGTAVGTYVNTEAVTYFNVLTKKASTVFKNGENGMIYLVGALYPLIVTLHQNNRLQVINVSNDQVEYIPIKDSNVVHAVLVDSANVVCASPTELQIWKAKNLKLPPRTLPLQDPKCTNPMPALNFNLCTLIDG